MRAMILPFLLLFSLHAQAGRLVGNGGEGILVDGRLYVRDLHEYGAHLTPWAGEEHDPELRKALAGWSGLRLSETESDLLLRKLSDAERRAPRLGHSLALAIRFFGWRLTQEELSLLPELFPVRRYPESARRAIAVRYLSTILVQERLFASLDSTNKVALILHEAAYALAKVVPVPSEDGGQAGPGAGYSVSQDLGATRSIVASLFSPPPASGGQGELAQLAREGLALSEGAYPLQLGSALSLRLELPAAAPIERALDAGAAAPEARRALVQEFCSAIPAGTKNFTVSIHARRPTLILQSAKDFGLNGVQLVLSVVDAAPEASFELRVRGGGLVRMAQPFDCNLDLQRGLGSWYEGAVHASWWR